MIAILASVLVPVFGDVIQKAQDSKATQQAKNVYTSYLIEHPEHAGSLFIYEADDRFVTIQNGAVTGLYDDQQSALAALIDNADASKLTQIPEPPVEPDENPGYTLRNGNRFANEATDKMQNRACTIENIYLTAGTAIKLRNSTSANGLGVYLVKDGAPTLMGDGWINSYTTTTDGYYGIALKRDSGSFKDADLLNLLAYIQIIYP